MDLQYQYKSVVWPACTAVCVMQWMWRSGKIRLRRMNVNWRSWRRMKTSRWRCCYRFFHSLTLSRDASALRTVNMSVLLPSLLWHYRRKITTKHTCVRVPAPALNSRPALKSPWISENWKSPWIVLKKEWKALKSLEFVCLAVWTSCHSCCKAGRRTA